MKIVIASQQPFLQAKIAPRFEAAPYYLAVDTATGRNKLFLHPNQFEVAFTPTGLLRLLGTFGPETIVAGSFSEEVRRVATGLAIELRTVHGRAVDAVSCACTGVPENA
jgi:predicted Fe-Mo cluster-binding NifX family protein